MKTYYYENPHDQVPDRGQFTAENDDEALTKMPKNAMCMYRESDTDDGLPFIMVYEASDLLISED